MHEVALAQGVLDTVLKEAARHGGGHIPEIRLRVGRLSRVAPESLQLAFEALSRGTCAEGAKLLIEPVPLRVRCRSCQAESEVAPERMVCPACGGREVEVVAGMDLLLESFELQE